MTRLAVAPDAAPLIDPLRGLIDAALARLPDVGEVRVIVAQSAAVAPGLVALPAAWLAADLQVSEERASPYALDKWRRAACAVLEAVAAMGLGGAVGAGMSEVGGTIGAAGAAGAGASAAGVAAGHGGAVGAAVAGAAEHGGAVGAAGAAGVGTSAAGAGAGAAGAGASETGGVSGHGDAAGVAAARAADAVAGATADPTAAIASWASLGLALFLADQACPELSLAAPDLAAAPTSMGPGPDPRVAVALAVAIQALGGDPRAEMGAWIAGEAPSPARWLALVAWTFGAGLVARVGGPVEPAISRDIPVDLPPWSWTRLDVPAHPRGGRVVAQDGAVVDQAWAYGGERLRTVAGALADGGRLLPEVGFPVGAWDCVSARGFGQIFGVRGMTWTFRGDGRLELLLADAFAGSPDAVAMAEQVGTSGVVPGRWRIAGPSRIAVHDLDTTAIAMHGRGEQRYAVPAGPLGMGQVIQAMQASSFGFELRDGELYLRGPLMGGEIELRMRRS